jgi:hypothetical protein
VVRQAGQLLAQLESRARAQDPQLDLFAAAEERDHPREGGGGVHAGNDAASVTSVSGAQPADVARHAELEALAQRLVQAEPDSLTPRQALDLLYALRESAARALER